MFESSSYYKKVLEIKSSYYIQSYRAWYNFLCIYAASLLKMVSFSSTRRNCFRLNNRAIYCSILLVLLLFLLSSCVFSGPVDCIEPDDWGDMPKTTISSVAPAGVETKNGQQVVPWTQGPELNGDRVIMVLRNKPFRSWDMNNGDMVSKPSLFFGAENSWAPMFGDTVYKSEATSFDRGNKVVHYSGVKGELCNFEGGETIEGQEPWCQKDKCDMELDDLQVLNFPCKLNWGRGLYYTTYKPNDSSQPDTPKNSSFKCELTTGAKGFSSCFNHIGDYSPRLPWGATDIKQAIPMDGAVFVNQGYPTTGLSFEPSDECKQGGCFLYFKIIDRYYGTTGQDNFGAYSIEFKQGAKTSYHQPITKFVALFKGLLCDVSKQFYEGIINSTEFATYIRVLLILAIICLGLGVLTGFVQMTYAQFLILALKIGLVLQITTTQSSWEFFNDRFFNFFINGVDDVTGIIFGASNKDMKPINVDVRYVKPGEKTCATQTLAGFLYFDRVISQLFSRETAAKAASLWIYLYGAGIIYYVIIYVCIIFMLFVIVKSIISYLVSFLTMAIIIGFAPLFIPFILFEQTRYLFDQWLKALISYFIQPIIILTFAFFMLQIFISQFHNLLGYRVCWKPLLQLPCPFCKGLDPNQPVITLWAWQADYDKDAKLCMLTPNAIMTWCQKEDVGTDKCNAIKQRTDSDALSFMGQLSIQNSPGNDTECASGGDSGGNPDPLCNPYVCMQKRFTGFPYLDPNFIMDQYRIDEFQTGWLVGLHDIILMVLTMWFLYEFSKTVPGIARQIATGSGYASGVGVGDAAGQFLNAAKRLGGAPYAFAKKMPGVKHLRALRAGVASIPGQLKERVAGAWHQKEEELSKGGKAAKAGAALMAHIRSVPGRASAALGTVQKLTSPDTAKSLVSSPLAPFKIAKVVTTPGSRLLGLTKGGQKFVESVEKNAKSITKPFENIANIPKDLKKFREAAKADLLDKAKEPFRKLDGKLDRKLGNKDVILDKRAESLYMQANEALASGKNARALYLARRAYEKDKESSLLKRMYANALEKNGEDLYQARGLLEDAMRKGDRSVQSDYARISKAIGEKEKKYDQLAQKLQQMSSGDPEIANVEKAKLKCGAELGRADDLRNLADRHIKEGNFADAYKLYEKALELNPQDLEARKAMQDNSAEFEPVKRCIEQRKAADKLIEERDVLLEKQQKWGKRLKDEGLEEGESGGIFARYSQSATNLYKKASEIKTDKALALYEKAAKGDDGTPGGKPDIGVGDSEAAVKAALLHSDNATKENNKFYEQEEKISKLDKQIGEGEKEIDKLLAKQHLKEKEEEELQKLKNDIEEAKRQKEAAKKERDQHEVARGNAKKDAKSLLLGVKGSAAAKAARCIGEENINKT